MAGGQTKWRNKASHRVVQMNGRDRFTEGIGRKGIEKDTGHWISGKKIQQLSGITGARDIMREKNGLGGKWYFPHRFLEVDGKRMKANDTSHWAMRGGCDGSKIVVIVS